jgi:hypothetical protein
VTTPFQPLTAPADAAFHFTDKFSGKSYVYATHSAPRDTDRKHVAFGIKDGKGREIGARFTTYRMDWTPRAGGSGLAQPEQLGTGWFVLDYHATRDGKDFGSSNPRGYFTSASGRDAAIEKYLADARKRAARAK